ncbi:SpaA isopeptide-forming pilin-related protein [Lagierella sp. ICN-221743]
MNSKTFRRISSGLLSLILVLQVFVQPVLAIQNTNDLPTETKTEETKEDRSSETIISPAIKKKLSPLELNYVNRLEDDSFAFLRGPFVISSKDDFDIKNYTFVEKDEKGKVSIIKGEDLEKFSNIDELNKIIKEYRENYELYKEEKLQELEPVEALLKINYKDHDELSVPLVINDLENKYESTKNENLTLKRDAEELTKEIFVNSLKDLEKLLLNFKGEEELKDLDIKKVEKVYSGEEDEDAITVEKVFEEVLEEAHKDKNKVTSLNLEELDPGYKYIFTLASKQVKDGNKVLTEITSLEKDQDKTEVEELGKTIVEEETETVTETEAKDATEESKENKETETVIETEKENSPQENKINKEETEAATKENEKVQEFEKAVEEAKEETQQDPNNKEEKKGLVEGIKKLFGLTDLQKADKELKAALKDEKNGLVEIQNLLDSFGEKYELSREEQLKLMDDNGDAIKALIAKDADENFRPQIFMNNPVGASPQNLANKKFTIRTRLDTSTITGAIQPGQFFEIKLDQRLTVKQGTTLPNIVNDGTTLAAPEYIEGKNTIKYTVKNQIAKNLQIPLAIDVDYNVDKINELDGIKETHPINNSISGLGVVRPVKLPEVIVNNNGDVVNGITEPDGHQVLQIVEPGSNYKVYMDAHGYPIVKDGKLVAVKWSVKFTSTKDLKDLGLSSNATLVKGSGLGELKDLLLNGKELTSSADGLSRNVIEGKFGIVASKNHTLQYSTKDVLYTFQTNTTNPQEKYALDLSVALNNIKKTGAVRLIYDAADNKSYMEDTTSKRAGINNRTTILGEFSSDTTARWTVTDQVSTEDKNKGLPIAKRELTGDQTLTSSKMAVYGLDYDTGKMVIKTENPGIDGSISINEIPDKESNPSGQQLPGRIAVYEFNTDITDSEAGYSLSGVNINKYQPIKIKQTWSGIDSTKKMPNQTIEVKDANGNTLSSPIEVGEGQTGKTDRIFNFPAVKTWKIGNDGSETKISPNIVQTFPEGPTIDGKKYTYKEKYNYFSLEDKSYHIYNIMTAESTYGKDADFTIIKTDSKDPKKKLSGAKFTLQSSKETITLETDSNGRASFKNISPGTYSLTENKAPAGYKLDQDVKLITVSYDGKVSVSGNNISMQGGKVPTVTTRHYSYPSYMNAMHYGSIDQNGNVEFYIYLKPEANVSNGSTNKNTRLNLNLAGGGQINDVQVIDISPSKRYDVRSQMQNQTASKVTGNNVINVSSQGTETITGEGNVKDSFTGKTGYQIKFPATRFKNDWGFLVKVSATGGTNTSTVSYDWLTDNTSVANEAKIQETIGLSTKSSDTSGTNPTSDEVTLNITNEAFKKSPVELTKVAENGIDGLSGATFTLKDSKGNPIIDVQSQSDKEGQKKGLASFHEQAPGKYIIEEKKAPEGYKKSNVVFDVNVSEDGKVTYKARFKDGDGTPINGIDYIVEDVEVGQNRGELKVTVVDQGITLQEKQTQPDDGRIGWQGGVWEAYGIESYRYSGTYNIANAVKGGNFKIQFDRNLDFKRYVYEIPDLKDGDGNLIAKPYFNYDTNLLTYVFENDAKNVNASIQIVGIIPDKYFATQTNKDTGYNFRITVDPDDSQASASNKKVIDFNVKTDYYSYDSQGGGGPLTSEYITDIYKGNDGNIYMKAVSYYNPTNMSSGQRTIRLDWLSMKKPRPGLEYYKAEGRPAFEFNDLKVYKVYGDEGTKKSLMPLSYGIRPEQDPSNYIRVYSKTNVNSKNGFSESDGDVRVTYRPEYLKSYEGLLDHGHEQHPLEINVPRVNGKEGYVIVQTFKVTDEQRFKDLWTGYYLSNGSRHTGSYQKGNYNWALGSETGKEIPKFYTQKIKLINKKYVPGSFKIKKTNEADGKDLQGAIFELRDSEGKTINRYSGSDGIVEFNNLEPGIYALQEVEAPKDFVKSNRRWQVVVYDNGNVVIREVGGTGTELIGKDTIVIPVTNKPVGEEFKVYKKKSDGTPLKDAKFVIMDKDETKEVSSGTSDEKGIVTFKPALERNQTYVIKETEAPAGYKKLDKKWVLVIDADGNKKVYNYREKSDNPSSLNSIIEKEGVNWVNVSGRSLDGWNLYDNRRTDWTGNFPTPFKMGTRIVAIKKDKQNGYVIQRYVLNPEAKSIGKTNGTIHREKIEYQNMDWYNGKAVAGTDYQVFKLNKAVTGEISDIRLAEYGAENITDSVMDSAKAVKGRYGEPDRLSLDFPATDKPIVVDIKVPYKSESGGIGTGMDWTENGTIYWKSDYYERVNIIKESGPVIEQSTGIQGSYIADGSLDVTNESKTFGFKLKKIKNNDPKTVIQGAEFKLTGPDPSKEERFMTTGSEGLISFDKLKPGTYKLEENNPAPGYEKSNVDWTVRITDEGKVFIKQNQTSSGTSRNANVSVSQLNLKQSSRFAVALRSAHLDTLSMAMGGLEIGDELVGQQVGAGVWEAVDPSKSEGRTNKTHTANNMETKITEINKQDDRFRQIFLFKPGSRGFAGKIEIHREPEPGNDLYLKLGTKEISNVKFYEVDESSTIDNITGKKEIKITPRQERNGTGPMRIKATLQANKAILVEVESSYADDGSIGLGADYEFRNKSGPYDNSNKSWAGDSYANEDGVNKNIQVKHKVNIDPNIQNGKVTADIYEAANDEIVTLTVTPNQGYELESLNVAGIDATEAGKKGKVTVKMANQDINVTATFKPVQTYPIIIDPDIKNGKVTSDKDKARQYEDVTITVKADPGYRLKQLYINRPGSDYTQAIYAGNGQMTFPMGNFRAEVYAIFEKDPNKAIISFDPNGGSGTMDKQVVNKGQYQIPDCSFTPPPGKIFRTWTIYENGYEYKYNPGTYVTIDNDYTFTAQWKEASVTLTSIRVNSTNHKTNYMVGDPLDTSNLTIEATMSNGSKKTINVSPAMVSGFDSSNPASNKPLTITYQGKTTTYYVNITKPQPKIYKINKVANINNGSITVQDESEAGKPVKITATPNPNYKLKSIKVTDQYGKNPVNVDANNTFIMPSYDVWINAEFEPDSQPQPKTHEISINYDPLRTITVKPTKSASINSVEVGERVDVSVTMNSNKYVLSHIYARNLTTLKDLQFTKTGPTTGYFIMPDADVTVSAETQFILNGTNAVNILKSNNGFVEANKVIARPNEIVTLTPRPNDGYKFDSYTVTDANGNTIPVTDNKFTMPNSAVNVSANFVSVGPITPGENEMEIPEGKFAQITNEQTGIELKIYKKSTADSPLIGAQFELKKTNEDYTQDDGTFKKVTAESDKDGNVTFVGQDGKPVKLQVGKYLLTETKSPAGYKKPAAPWKLEVKEEGGKLVITQSGPKHSSTSYLSSDGAKAGETKPGETIKYKSIIKNIDPVNKTFVQRIYVDTRGYDGKVNVQITPTTKREEIDTPSQPPKTTSGGVKTAYRTTYKVSNPGENPNINEILKDYDLRKSNVSVVNTARWRPFDWGFDEDQINLDKDGVYFIDIEGFYDDNIKDPGEIELKIDFYGGERIFAQRTFKNGRLGWKYDKDIGVDEQGNQIKRDAAYQQGMEALYAYYTYYYGEAKAKEWFYGNSDNKKYAVWLRKGATINGQYYPAGQIVLASDPTNPKNTANTTPIQTSYTKANIKDLYSSNVIKTVPQEGMTITNEDETYNITFSKHAKQQTDPNKQEDFNANRLEGAVFKLQKKEGSFWYDLDDSYVASAFNGYFGFRRLEPGRYRLLEVTPPEGYKPIEGPLLEFTIKQIDTRSGKIINPRTKKEVDLVDLTIVDPYNQEKIALNTAKAKIKGDTTNKVYDFKDLVKDENKFNIDTCIILSEVKNETTGQPKEIPLKEANYLDPETKEPMGRIISGAQGYISLEYKPGGYVAEYGNAGSSGGSLVDYVTSATAKNMGKILNEKPGKGKVTIKKFDDGGQALKATDLLPGAEFEAIRISAKKDADGKPVKDAVYKRTVNKDGVLVIDGLPIGNYELREVEAPKGYINPGQVWHFTVGGKTLDPYAGDIARTGNDLTSKINISKSELKVLRPDPDDAKATSSEKNRVIRPHIGQSLEFDNEFNLDSNIEIKPGDYFVLKLSDNIDLDGIRENVSNNLDLFADGVGTIAKADYNKQAGTITYTFTKYAEQYKLLNFENKITAHITLDKVTKSGNQNVGIGLENNKDNYKNIYVKYVVDTIERSDNTNSINMASKLYHYNPKTGEFVHYFYVNRDRKYNGKDLYFKYTPSIDVKDLQFTYYKLWDNSNEAIARSMPESFAVNENGPNLRRVGGMPPTTIKANQSTEEQEIGKLDVYGPMIIKVTGTMDTKNLLSYRGISDIYNYNTFYSYRYGRYITEKYPGVSRTDWIFEFESTNTASAELTISAVNPSNKIQFKKVDEEGQVIKPVMGENNSIKDAAYFSLFKNGGTAEKPDASWTPIGNAKPVDKDGIVSYEKLEKGYYKLLETTAPEGYIKPNEAVSYFKVDESGKIYHKVTVPKADGKGTEDIFQEVEGTIPINIVNKKLQKIKFKKVDETKKTVLEGAEFEVWYKANKDDKQYIKLKIYEKTDNGITERIVIKEGANVPDGYKEATTDKFTTGKDGLVEFNVCDSGYYALKEVKAPKGYIAPRDYVKEFEVVNGKIQEEKYLTSMEVSKKKGYGFSNDTLQNAYSTSIVMKFNSDHQNISYPKDNSKITLSGLPLGSEFWDNRFSPKQGLKIEVYSIDNKNGAEKLLKTYDLGKNYDSKKGSQEINLYDLLKGDNTTTTDSIESDKAIVFRMSSTLYLNTQLDIGSKVVIGDKVNEDRSFHIGTKGDAYEDHSYSFTTKGTVDLSKPIEVENRKAEYPLTGGIGALIFAIIGAGLMTAAYIGYKRKKVIE